MSIRFTEQEERDFLTAAHTGIVTTVRRDGWPISLPTWFVYVDGAIYFRTPTKSKKVARARHDSRACFLVEAGQAWAGLHAVLWLGRLTEVTDEPLRDRVGAALRDKYSDARVAQKDMPAGTQKAYGTSDVLFELRPDERRLSWDNRKIDLTRGAR